MNGIHRLTHSSNSPLADSAPSEHHPLTPRGAAHSVVPGPGSCVVEAHGGKTHGGKTHGGKTRGRRTLPWRLRALAHHHRVNGCYQRALAYYDKSFDEARRLGLAGIMAPYHYNNIGVTLLNMGQLKPAREMLERSLTTMITGRQDKLLGHSYAYLASVYQEMGRFDSALYYVWRDMQQIQKIGFDAENGRSLLAVARVLNDSMTPKRTTAGYLAEIGEQTGLPLSPVAYFEAAIDAAQAADYGETLIPALAQYGYFLYRSGLQPEGKTRLREAWHEAERRGLTGEMGNIITLCRRRRIRLPAAAGHLPVPPSPAALPEAAFLPV